MALLIASSIPAIYLSIRYNYELAALNTEIEITADYFSRFINKNPDIWIFMEERLADLMARRSHPERQENRTLIDKNGHIIYGSNAALAPPIQVATHPIYDSGLVVGQIQISRSFRPILKDTVRPILYGLFLGVLVFLIFRAVPLRALINALRALYYERERLAITLASIVDGVISTDISGRISVVNRAAQKITGYSRAEIRGSFFDDFFLKITAGPEEKRKELLRRVLQENATTEIFSATTIETEGTEKKVSLVGVPLKSDTGEVTGTVFILQDITEKNRMEEEILRNVQLEKLGILAGGLAHDFNNLLTVIINNVNRVMLKYAQDEYLRPIVKDIEDASIQAKDLAQQLLTFSTGGDPIMGNLSIGKLLKQATSFALSGSNIKLDLQLGDNLWPVYADAGQLRQVIHNLVLNSLHAMPAGGEIIVRAENFCQDTGPGNGAIPESYSLVTIQDFGHGIPEKHQNNVFVPYFTTKPGGSGLGLSICHSIITKHVGRIWFDSKEGEGTTFYFLIPADPGADIPSEPATSRELIKGTGRILFMDDNQLLAVSVRKSLISLGYSVELAQNGDEAISLYTHARQSETPFDVVIMDLTIQGGKGGLETIKILKGIDPNIKTILSSGFSKDHLRSKYPEYGFSSILPKPYSMSSLSQTIHELMNSS